MTHAREGATKRSAHRPRSTRVRTQVDCAVAIALNVVLLFVVNVWPTWRALPFVTDDALQAVVILNVAAIVAILLNVLCLTVEAGWLKPLTEFINAALALIFAMEVWRAFPFDFPPGSFDWELFARIVIVCVIVGSVIGMIVQFILVIVRAVEDRDLST